LICPVSHHCEALPRQSDTGFRRLYYKNCSRDRDRTCVMWRAALHNHSATRLIFQNNSSRNREECNPNLTSKHLPATKKNYFQKFIPCNGCISGAA